MILRANCKINIGLRVRRKREDGYHEIETLFYPVKGLYDELEILVESRKSKVESRKSKDKRQESKDIVLCQEGIEVDCAAEDNLIVKTYRRMAGLYPQIGAVRVCLRKHIPFGAGLGGGSSDAAHTAIALNQLFDLQLNKEALAEVVRPIGADCPFFVYNEPCLATGIGDRLQPVDFSWAGRRLIMLKPSVGVSTKEAYAGIRLHDTPLDLRVNDFEETVFARYPLLGRAKEALLRAGADYAAMSGSGSTIYGVFDKNTESGALPNDRLLDEEFASMVIFDDTL